eukprot:4873775-Pyramimonas_sp.AAC.1
MPLASTLTPFSVRADAFSVHAACDGGSARAQDGERRSGRADSAPGGGDLGPRSIGYGAVTVRPPPQARHGGAAGERG